MGMHEIEQEILQALDIELAAERYSIHTERLRRSIVAACRVMHAANEAETVALQKQINDLRLQLAEHSDPGDEDPSEATNREIHREPEQQFDMDRAWQCANRSCPPRPPTRGTSAPKCYTCDRQMVAIGAISNTIQAVAAEVSRNGIPIRAAKVLQNQNPCREINTDVANHEIKRLHTEHPQIRQYEAWLKSGGKPYRARHQDAIDALLLVEGVARVDVSTYAPRQLSVMVTLSPGVSPDGYRPKLLKALRQTVAAWIKIDMSINYSSR